jgi:hypothetical protein
MTNDIFSVKSSFVEIPCPTSSFRRAHFMPDFVIQAGVRKDKWSYEVRIGEQGRLRRPCSPIPLFLANACHSDWSFAE